MVNFSFETAPEFPLSLILAKLEFVPESAFLGMLIEFEPFTSFLSSKSLSSESINSELFGGCLKRFNY